MKEFQNRLINEIYVSRIVASWAKACWRLNVKCYYGFKFANWLKTLGLSNDDVAFVLNYANNGKLELETSAEKFIKNHIG